MQKELIKNSQEHEASRSKTSQEVWLYILMFKHEVFVNFKEWKQLVKNQTRSTIKKLRTDNGHEFCNWEFEQLCTKSRISRHLTIAEIPYENGLVQRMNRTIMDKIPMEMWLGHPCDYRMLRAFGCVSYSHVKQDTLKNSGAGTDKSVWELQVEVKLRVSNNHTLKEDQSDQEDGNDEDAGDQETNQTPDLTDYQLV
nr:retrovirus-related Pol polyprotein from transposon TNT 1-94 [Tanacetum cinerariifolium]